MVPQCSLPNRVAFLRVDGFDQAKTKLPRNVENTKQWSTLWRPALHVIGVTIEGLVSMFFIADPDLKKDSNTECTVVAMALEFMAYELKARGTEMPEHLVLKYDNTGREGKNQHFAKFMAWLVAGGKFQSVGDGSGQVGHTHDRQDQDFAVASTIFSQCNTLETKGDFAQADST